MGRQLMICRHGECCEWESSLNEQGRKDMGMLANHLSLHIQGRKTRILSSVAPRAVQSAEILQLGLGLDGFDQHEVLWSDTSHPVQVEQVKGLVLRAFEEHEVVILVTHLEYAKMSPGHFIDQPPAAFSYCELQKGWARITGLDTYADCIVWPNGNEFPLERRLIPESRSTPDSSTPRAAVSAEMTTRVLDEGDDHLLAEGVDDFPF